MLMAGWKEHWEGLEREGRGKEWKHKLTCYSQVEAKKKQKQKEMSINDMTNELKLRDIIMAEG